MVSDQVQDAEMAFPESEFLRELLEGMRNESARLAPFYASYNFAQEPPKSPKNASAEQRRLARIARTPLLRLVVEATVEPLKVEGYRPSHEFAPEDEGEVPFAWRCWQFNDLASRQAHVHRDAAIAGYGYVTVVPGEGPDGESIPRIRPVSPRKMYAEFDDPYADEFPIHAVQDLGRGRFRFFDEEKIVDYVLREREQDGHVRKELVRDGGVISHGAGVCPVVRFENLIDTEGRCFGEVEPYLDIAERFDTTSNDKLLVQRHNSWKVMYATGLKPPQNMTDEERKRTKVQMRQDDMILAGPEVKFGQLDETSMTGFLASLKDELELLSSISQTPTSVLSGNLVNLSADALAEARIMHTLKLMQRMTNFGAEWERLLRLACVVGGEAEAAKDYQAAVVWAEIEVRSLAQTIDAFSKMAQTLEVPPLGLWDKIPSVTTSDVSRWKHLREVKREEDLGIEAILAQIEASAEGGVAPKQMQAPATNSPTAPKEMPTYENMDKPWSRAARGGNRSTDLLRRKRLKQRDGDGDGIVGE